MRTPVVGRVKTRLEAALGKAAVLRIYESFIRDVMETAQSTGRPVIPVLEGATDTWRPPGMDAGAACFSQRGADLGARMETAFIDAFDGGYDAAVLLGTDVPDIPACILDTAAAALTRCGWVIGPARDGGYYLIGFTKDGFLPAVFSGIEWGGPRVFETTLAVFRSHGAAPHILPVWRDIDTPADLDDFIAADPKTAPHTVACLRNMGTRFRLPRRHPPQPQDHHGGGKGGRNQ
jgi:hypothetical protein